VPEPHSCDRSATFATAYAQKVIFLLENCNGAKQGACAIGTHISLQHHHYGITRLAFTGFIVNRKSS
jgi:hypothetical protein